MLYNIYKTITGVGVSGVAIFLFSIFANEMYKYFSLVPADYALSSPPDFLIRSAFIFFFLAMAGLLGMAVLWLGRLSR